MNDSKFIELTFKNGTKRIVNKRYIISIEQVAGDTHIIISGVNHFETVQSPSYQELYNLLLSDKEGQFRS